MTFDERDRPLNESRGRDDDASLYSRTDELKQIRVDRVDDQCMFIGRAVDQDTLTSEALWQIQRRYIDTSNVEVKEFAALGAYTQVWDDRASIFPAVTKGTAPLDGVQVVTPEDVTMAIENITIAVANTEQSLALPASIKGYMIRTRTAFPLKLSHVATESGTKFLTIPSNSNFIDEHSYASLTLYFQSPTSGGIIEVVSWA